MYERFGLIRLHRRHLHVACVYTISRFGRQRIQKESDSADLDRDQDLKLHFNFPVLLLMILILACS